MPKESDVWKHFTRLTDGNGNIIHKAKCNKCAPGGKEFSTTGGTTNMWRHFLNDYTRMVRDEQGDKKVSVQCTICHSSLRANGRKPVLGEVKHVLACIQQQNAAAARASPPPVHTSAPPGSGPSSMDIETAGLGAQPSSVPSCPVGPSSDGEPSVDEPSRHLAEMIALDGYDPSIVDNVRFRCFLRSLKPEFTMPSRVEIEKECDRVFDEATRDLLSRLSSSHGRVCLAVRTTKIFDKKFIYICCHFIDDEWMHRKLVIKAFADEDDEGRLVNLSGFEKIYIGMWPGELADMVFQMLEEHGVSNRVSMLTYETNNHRGLCLELKDSILSDTRQIFCTTYVDVVLHAIARSFFPGDYIWESELEEELAKLQLTREERQQLSSHLDLDDPWIYHDEDWYGVYYSLKVLRMESSNATNINSLGGELLSKVCEWKRCITVKYDDFPSEFLYKVLEQIHHAIQRIAAPSYPAPHLCLEVLLNIRKFLQSELKHLSINDTTEDLEVDPDDLSADAIETLDKAIRDSYLVWSIPLALDPRYKLQHICSIFQGAFEPVVATEYYSKVTERINNLYVDYRNDEVGTRTGAGHSDSGVAIAVADKGDDGDDPVHQSGWAAEWTRYISDDPAPPEEAFDILQWWKKNSQKFPTLARMARDALAMPTCSKPSSDETAQIRSIVRGYSKKPFIPCIFNSIVPMSCYGDKTLYDC